MIRDPSQTPAVPGGLPFDATQIQFLQSGTGAVARAVQSKERDSVSVLDFGANTVPGTTDMLAAFNAAIASFGTGSGGGTILAPHGTYFLSDDLKISKQIHLEGDGGIDVFGTKLLFADGKGVRVYHSGDSPDGGDGSWSVIKNLGVVAQAKTVLTSGFRISGHGVRLENFYATGFKNKGVSIGNAANGGVGNANNWVLDNGRLTNNDSDGLFVDGADSNAGVAILVDASNNGGWGIYDSSFLGNTYLACHSATNTLGAYKTDDANAQNQLLGCYSESGQPASSLVSPTQVIGGLHGAGFTAGSNHSYVTAGGGNGLTRGLSGFQLTQVDGSAHTIETRLGGDVNNGDILYMSKSDADSGFAHRLRWASNKILFDRANLQQLFSITPGANIRWSWKAAMDLFRSVVTYSASMTPDASASNEFDITATNGTAFTINAPTNPIDGQRITITLRNASGGALGAATWDAVFKMSAWTNPANAFSRSIDFKYNATNWVQVSQTGVDVPN